jgi:hypothetical protein
VFESVLRLSFSPPLVLALHPSVSEVRPAGPSRRTSRPARLSARQEIYLVEDGDNHPVNRPLEVMGRDTVGVNRWSWTPSSRRGFATGTAHRYGWKVHSYFGLGGYGTDLSSAQSLKHIQM